MSQSYPQQGVGGMDSRYLRADGTLPLTDFWAAGQRITVTVAQAYSGGYISLGNNLGNLRICYNANEIAQLLGVSNNQATLC